MIHSAKPCEVATESVFKPTLWLMCGRTIAAIAAFLIPVLLARIFAPAEYGTYKQVFLIYATLYGLFQFGMAESLYYFLPRTPASAGSYVLNAVMALICAGVTGLFLLVSQAQRVAEWLNNGDLKQYLPLLGANLVFMIASAPLEIALVSRKRYRWAALFYASDVVRVLFFLTPLLIWRNLHALLAGSLIFALLRFGAALVSFAREFGREFRPSWILFKQQFAYALPFQLAVIVEIAQTNYHQYAVAHSFDAAAFAIYSVGCLQIPLIDFFASPAGNVMMVLMSERQREGQRERMLALWHDTTRKLALFFLPVSALLMFVANDLIPFVFTSQYQRSVPIFAIWMVTVALTIFQTDAVLRVFAATRFLLFLNCIRLLAVAMLLYLALAEWGMVGAVISTVLAMMVSKVVALMKIRHLFHVSAGQLLPWRQLAAIAAMAATACVGPLIIQHSLQSLLPRLLLSSITYAVIYVACLWHFDILNGAEKAGISAYVPHITALRLSTKVAGNS